MTPLWPHLVPGLGVELGWVREILGPGRQPIHTHRHTPRRPAPPVIDLHDVRSTLHSMCVLSVFFFLFFSHLCLPGAPNLTFSRAPPQGCLTVNHRASTHESDRLMGTAMARVGKPLSSWRWSSSSSPPGSCVRQLRQRGRSPPYGSWAMACLEKEVDDIFR
ncbi:hypothetical protein LZ30DRAFT_387373 [Colletotrichum cereale]|nr:hypothetical protein LZ30DRAFT_387373 [Colletotrichum cereale]